MADERVREVQQWLNDTFPSYFKYDEDETKCGSYPIKPDGYTGTKTVKALVMAIQIHYNLTPVDGIWGNATSSACPEIKYGVNDSTIIKIAQGGFYCKGYEAGGFDGIFGSYLASAIALFKTHLGITSSNIMEQDVFKALLTTDPTILTIGGSSMVRTIQQYLNGNYYSLYKNKLGYIPTGGKYERKTSKALIYAFQKEIGTTADGVLGKNTFSNMPSIGPGCSNSKLVKILQAALACNGYEVDFLDGVYNDTVTAQVTAFQHFMCLHNDSNVEIGKVNRRTWGALLWSKGDTERTPNAGDCWQRLDYIKAKSLYDDGYRYIGRYLTKVENGLDKNMTPEEITDILLAGLKIFPIFQESNNSIDSFNYVSGYLDGYKAIMKATELMIPPHTAIYFAVDFDALEEEAKNEISEYFRGINQAKKDVGSTYEVGIYSARNTCSIICNQNLATSSFVSDMSTGYSGNLGFLLPENWAYDQYKALAYTSSNNSTFDLDGVIASENAKFFDYAEIVENDFWNAHKYNIGLNALQAYSNHAVTINSIIPLIAELESAYWEYNPTGNVSDCMLATLYYLWKDKYSGQEFFDITLEEYPAFKAFVDSKPLASYLSTYINGNYSFLKDGSLITETTTDGMEITYSHMLELPHLAIIISAYIDFVHFPTLKREWFGWAGDLSTGIQEVTLVMTNHPESTPIEHARDRIGKMEVLPNNPYNLEPTYEVQMNFCDITADMDSIGIVTLINRHLAQNIDHSHVLSDSLSLYYTEYYTQRYAYWLNDFKPTSYTIDGITQSLIDYFNDAGQTALVALKIGSLNHEALAVSCRSFAEIITHYRKNNT